MISLKNVIFSVIWHIFAPSERHPQVCVKLLPPVAADAGVRRHEPRMDRERVAAQPGFAAVSLLLHGVPGGCPYA